MTGIRGCKRVDLREHRYLHGRGTVTESRTTPASSIISMRLPAGEPSVRRGRAPIEPRHAGAGRSSGGPPAHAVPLLVREFLVVVTHRLKRGVAVAERFGPRPRDRRLESLQQLEVLSADHHGDVLAVSCDDDRRIVLDARDSHLVSHSSRDIHAQSIVRSVRRTAISYG